MKTITKKIAVLFLAVVMTVAFVPQSLLNAYAEDAEVTASSQEQETTPAPEPKDDPAPAPDPAPSSNDSGSSADTTSDNSDSVSQEPTSPPDANQEATGNQDASGSSAEKGDKDSSNTDEAEPEAVDGQEAVESEAEEVVEEEPEVSAKATESRVLEYGASTSMQRSLAGVYWDISGDTDYADAGAQGLTAYRVTNRNTSKVDKHVTVDWRGLVFVYDTYNITLRPQKVNVTLMLQEAGESSFSQYGATQTLYNGESASLAQLGPVTKDGVTYDFYGWYTDEACKTKVSSFTVEDSTAANVELYAKYAPEIQVTYDPNTEDDGVTVPEPFSGGAGTTVELSSNASRPGGWELASWNTEADGSGTSYEPNGDFKIPDSNTTLYAQWTPHMVTITYHFPIAQDDLQLSVQDTTRQNIITDQPNPLIPILVFKGWSTSSTDPFGTAAYFPGDSFTVDGDMDFYATWGVTSLSAFLNDVQITGKSETLPYNGSVQSVEGITAEEHVAGEYYIYFPRESGDQPLFALVVDCSGIVARGTDVGQYSTPITAPIRAEVYSPFITIDIPVGTIVSITAGILTITPAEFKVITESAEKKYDGTPLTAEGSLEGIFNSDATIETTGSQTEVGESQNTYKLHWKDTNTHENYGAPVEEIGTLKVYYEVAFDANGGSGAPDSMKVIEAEATLPSDKPTYSGHDFLGWATSSSATSAEYQPGGSISVNDHMTLYAVWSEFSYSFVAGDGQTWTKGSGTTADFTVKRSTNDDLTFEKFTGVSVDGQALSASDYSASAGSVNLSLSAAFLETLAAGQHKITANFEDGSANASFIVAEAPASDEDSDADEDNDGEVATGDDMNLFTLLILMATALLGLIAVFLRRRHAE